MRPHEGDDSTVRTFSARFSGSQTNHETSLNPCSKGEMIFERRSTGNHIVFEGFLKGTHTGPLVSPEGEVPPTGRSVEVRIDFIVRVSRSSSTASSANGKISRSELYKIA